jgi:transposase
MTFMTMRDHWAEPAVKRERYTPTLERMIAENDPVRLFDEVLAEVDWRSWEAEYPATNRGQPPIHPRIVASAILYGLYRDIRSSRKLEEACCYRFDFMWLVECRRIDHTTFAKFRTRFHQPLKDLFRQIGRIAMRLGLIRLGEVAFDGTRVKANNSRYKTRTAQTLEDKLQALDERFEQLTSQCQAADAQEADEGSPTQLPESLDELKKRREKLAAALEQARAADQVRSQQGVDPTKNPAQVPMTDPASRVMPNKEGGYAPNYTPTAITDGTSGFIVDCDVLARVNESDALAESVDRIEETFGQKPEKMLTDAGNSNGRNMAAMQERGIEFYAPAKSLQPQPGNPACRDNPQLPVPESQWSQLPRNNQGQLDKSCFVYEAQTDQYYCPQGQPLSYEQTKRERRGEKQYVRRVYRCATCAACPLASACLATNGQRGRTINRDQHEELHEQTAARMADPAARAIYNQRPRIAETTFGIIKSVMGLRQFLLRGLEKVKTEWQWAATAFNVIKLVRAIGRMRADFAQLSQMA